MLDDIYELAEDLAALAESLNIDIDPVLTEKYDNSDDVKQNANTCHNPAGNENGGQFCSGDGTNEGSLIKLQPLKFKNTGDAENYIKKNLRTPFGSFGKAGLDVISDVVATIHALEAVKGKGMPAVIAFDNKKVGSRNYARFVDADRTIYLKEFKSVDELKKRQKLDTESWSSAHGVVGIVLHEVGHAIDYATNFSGTGLMASTIRGQTNTKQGNKTLAEAFTEAFTEVVLNDPRAHTLDKEVRREITKLVTNKYPSEDVEKKAKPVTKTKALDTIAGRLKTTVGASSVILKGLQPEDAEDVLGVLVEESEYHPVMIDKIDNTQGGIAHAGAAITREAIQRAGNNIGKVTFTLHLPAKNLSRERMRADVGGYESMIANYQSAIESLKEQAAGTKPEDVRFRMRIHMEVSKYENEVSRMRKAMLDGIPYVPQNISYLYPPGGDRIKALARHEVGHYRWYNLDKQQQAEIRSTFMSADADKWFPSKNSKKDDQEWWSEHYALFRGGKPHHPIVDKIMGHVISKG